MLKFFSVILLFSIQLKANAQQDAIIKNADTFIHYKTIGNGKPILIINGGPGMNSNGFDGIAKLLSKNNMAITYDQRGTGKSVLQKTDSNSITMDLMVEDIEVLRKHLKIDNWIILGHSFGGMLASYYATIHPEHVESIILSSSGGIDLGLLSSLSIQSKLTKQESDSLNYWNKKIEGGDTSYNARLRRGMALAPAYVFDKKYVPVIAERLTQGNATINTLVWSDLQKIKFDCAKKLSTFDKPVLIIQGDHDILDKTIALKEHKAFKNSTLVFLEHSAHYGWLDNTEAYLSAVEKFLAHRN
jgi:proline iminopeptidase